MPKSETLSAVTLKITGRVQGVGFRYFVLEQAETAGITGWVRNCPDGSVECEGEGSRPALEGWIDQLKKGPPLSRVDKTTMEWKPASRQHATFEIR